MLNIPFNMRGLCVAVQLCRRAVLQRAARQTIRGRVGGYFRKKHLGNGCKCIGFTTQNQDGPYGKIKFLLAKHHIESSG